MQGVDTNVSHGVRDCDGFEAHASVKRIGGNIINTARKIPIPVNIFPFLQAAFGIAIAKITARRKN